MRFYSRKIVCLQMLTELLTDPPPPACPNLVQTWIRVSAPRSALWSGAEPPRRLLWVSGWVWSVARCELRSSGAPDAPPAFRSAAWSRTEPPSTTIAPVSQAERLQAAVVWRHSGFLWWRSLIFRKFPISKILFHFLRVITNLLSMRAMDSRDALPPSLLKFYPSRPPSAPHKATHSAL